VTQAGARHEVIKTGGGAKAAKTVQWVNTALGNIKAAIVGTTAPCGKSMCRAISPNSNIDSTADTSSKT